MTPETALAQKIEGLQARQDIHDVLVRYCRGADRCDAAAMKSCFHDGAWDDHGFYDGPAADFCDQAADSLRERFISTKHYMTNHHVEIDGNAAASESYILALMRKSEDGALLDVSFSARYLDRFEKRDEMWKIVHRVLVSDGNRVDPVAQQDARLDLGKAGARGTDDPSHQYFSSPNDRVVR
jgi:SnoaL-like domain